VLGPSVPAILPPESLRSWWCRWSCFLFTAVRGVQPRGGWRSSAIARLQGFSSCSPAAVPRQWPSRRMTTSLAVGRCKPGYGFPPSFSFKDVHHPRWSGGRAKSGPCPPRGLVTRFFLQHSEEKGVHQPCGGGKPRLRGADWLQAVSCSVFGPLGWMASAPPLPLPPAALAGAWLSVHRTGDSRAVRGSGTSTPSPTRRPHWGSYKTSYAVGVAPRSWMVLSSLP
jgi:hypothetical protein